MRFCTYACNILIHIQLYAHTHDACCISNTGAVRLCCQRCSIVIPQLFHRHMVFACNCLSDWGMVCPKFFISICGGCEIADVSNYHSIFRPVCGSQVRVMVVVTSSVDLAAFWKPCAHSRRQPNFSRRSSWTAQAIRRMFGRPVETGRSACGNMECARERARECVEA